MHLVHTYIPQYSGPPMQIKSCLSLFLSPSPSPSPLPFLSSLHPQSKLYATESSGKPTRWDSKYQGYIAKWHTYFRADSYFQDLMTNNKQMKYTKLGLWMNFAFLNALIPVVFMKRGEQILYAIALSTSRKKSTLQQILVAISIFNAAYFCGVMVSHIKHHQRFCCDILGTFITKLIVLPAALLVELTTATYYAMRMKTSHSMCASTAIKFAFALWQLFIFVQITLGLISIPLLIMILISPAQSILITGAMCIPLFLFTFILVVTLCTKSCKYMLKSHWITLLENLVAACLVTFAFLTYYIIVSYGASMNSIKGYILSLIPTVYPFQYLCGCSNKNLRTKMPSARLEKESKRLW